MHPTYYYHNIKIRSEIRISESWSDSTEINYISNTFCQFLHDGCTLKNKIKCQSFGIQFAQRKLRCNHVIVLRFKKVANSRANSVPNSINTVVHDMT